MVLHTFKEHVREFLTASRNPYSYNPFKNIYIWFGFIWGLPIPLAGLISQAYCTESYDISTWMELLLASPVQYIFFATPPIFAFLFGILGTVRQQKEEEVNNLIGELKRISTRDSLTSLFNRRHFGTKLHEEMARAQRSNNPLALIFFDIDHFKNINDSHGHRMGDEILRITGAHLKEKSRSYDISARWGGEEFLMLLPDTNDTTALLFAERIRTSFAATIEEHLSIAATISIGVVTLQPEDTVTRFIERADRAMYHAKATGRNKVASWEMVERTQQAEAHQKRE